MTSSYCVIYLFSHISPQIPSFTWVKASCEDECLLAEHALELGYWKQHFCRLRWVMIGFSKWIWKKVIKTSKRKSQIYCIKAPRIWRFHYVVICESVEYVLWRKKRNSDIRIKKRTTWFYLFLVKKHIRKSIDTIVWMVDLGWDINTYDLLLHAKLCMYIACAAVVSFYPVLS